jgi:hypothetical protein
MTPIAPVVVDECAGQLVEISQLLADLVEQLAPRVTDLAAHENANAVAVQVSAWPSAGATHLRFSDLRRLGDLCGPALSLEFSTVLGLTVLTVRSGLTEPEYESFQRDAKQTPHLVVNLNLNKETLLNHLNPRLGVIPARGSGKDEGDSAPSRAAENRGEA